MRILLVICVGIIIAQTILFYVYQRQIQNICRQLAFLKKHDSNMFLHCDIGIGCIQHLVDELNDMLELRKKEKQSYQKKEAQLSDTYTNLSHDIRTPLTSLDGYLQLLEETENPEERTRYLFILHERIDTLKEMLEELFMFAKLKNETYALELMPCCINRILKQTIFSYYEDWRKEDICPQIQITEESLQILGNIQGLHRVIQNVIKNGLDHGQKEINIRLEREKNYALLSISNFVLHPEEIQIEQVFEKFYKADISRNKTSTGLGLSIAKELVKKMNGEITATMESNLFCIEIRFPLYG